MKLMNKTEKTEYVSTLFLVETARDEKARKSHEKYYMTYEYIELDDGTVLSVPKTHIKNEFWYDDETADPLPSAEDARKSFFVNANMERFDDLGYKSWVDSMNSDYISSRTIRNPFVVTTEPRKSSSDSFVCFFNHWGRNEEEDWRERGADIRYLTPEELHEMGEIMEGLRAKFAKRLETYWKRYSRKVTSHGYWANR